MPPGGGRRAGWASQKRSVSSASRTSAGRPGTGASGSAASPSQSGCGQAAGDQRRAPAPPASARSRAGQMASKRGARALRLLRRARQQRGNPGIPRPGGQALVPGAAASQPAHPPELGTHGPPRHPVSAPGPDQASMAERAIRRPHPRQEPSAVIPLAGICAGGRPQGGPYRDRPVLRAAGGEIPCATNEGGCREVVRQLSSVLRERWRMTGPPEPPCGGRLQTACMLR